MPRLKPEHIAELNRLHAQCKAAIDFLYNHGHLTVGRAEAESGIADAFAKQELRGMRMALRDLRAWVSHLPAMVRQGVDRAVASATGVGLSDGASQDAAKARAIIQRGRIRNASEFYLIRARLDQIEGTGATEEAQLRSLIAAFEVRE